MIPFSAITLKFAYITGRKAIRSGDYRIVHAGVPRIVPGLAYDDEFATGPVLSESPWCDERPSEVQSAVNQDAGNTGKAVRFSQENTIFQPGVVAPISE